MPVIRCSNEVYRLLQDKGLQDDEPVSIVLDRIVFLELKKPKPEVNHNPRPKRKRKRKAEAITLPEPAQSVVDIVKPKPEPQPWPWKVQAGGAWLTCGKCGQGVRGRDPQQAQARGRRHKTVCPKR